MFGDELRLPLSRRRRLRSESADGGGATTDGAGRMSFALREDSRSGAETGGGMTALFICTREGETSWLTDEGAGGMIWLLRAGAVRCRSREMRVDGGAITDVFKVGAERAWSSEIWGAGAMMRESSVGAKSA